MCMFPRYQRVVDDVTTASTIAEHLLVGSLHFQDAAGRFLSPVGRLRFSFRCFWETNHDQNDTNTAAMIFKPVPKRQKVVWGRLQNTGTTGSICWQNEGKKFCEIRGDQEMDSKFERVTFVWCFGLTENIVWSHGIFVFGFLTTLVGWSWMIMSVTGHNLVIPYDHHEIH